MRSASWWLAAIAVGLLAGIGLSSGVAASVTLTSQAFTPYRTCTITATPVSAKKMGMVSHITPPIEQSSKTAAPTARVPV